MDGMEDSIRRRRASTIERVQRDIATVEEMERNGVSLESLEEHVKEDPMSIGDVVNVLEAYSTYASDKRKAKRAKSMERKLVSMAVRELVSASA